MMDICDSIIDNGWNIIGHQCRRHKEQPQVFADLKITSRTPSMHRTDTFIWKKNNIIIHSLKYEIVSGRSFKEVMKITNQ